MPHRKQIEGLRRDVYQVVHEPDQLLVSSFRFAANGNDILGHVAVFDPDTATLLHEIDLPSMAHILRGGAQVLCMERPSVVRDLPSGRVTSTANIGSAGLLPALAMVEAPGGGPVLHASGSELHCINADGTLRWTQTHRLFAQYFTYHWPVDSRVVVVCASARRGTLVELDAGNGTVLSVTPAPLNHNTEAILCPGGLRALITSPKLAWLDVVEGSLLPRPLLQKHRSKGAHFAFSPDGSLLAAATPQGRVDVYASDATILVFSVETGVPDPLGLSWCTDGQWLAMLGSDGTLVRWPVGELTGGAAPPRTPGGSLQDVERVAKADVPPSGPTPFRDRVHDLCERLKRQPGLSIAELTLSAPPPHDALDVAEKDIKGPLPSPLRAIYAETDGFTVRWRTATGTGEIGIPPLLEAIADGSTDAFEDVLWNECFEEQFEGKGSWRTALNRLKAARLLWSDGSGRGRQTAFRVTKSGEEVLHGECNDLTTTIATVEEWLDAWLDVGGVFLGDTFHADPAVRQTARHAVLDELRAALPDWPVPSWLR